MWSEELHAQSWGSTRDADYGLYGERTPGNIVRHEFCMTCASQKPNKTTGTSFFLITAPCISYIPWSDQPAGGLPQRCDKWLKHPGKTTDDASRRLTNIKAFWEPPHQKNVVVVVDPKASAHLLGNQIFCQIGAKHSQKNEIKNIWCFFWNPAQGRIGWPGGPASARELPVENHQVYRQHTCFKVHVGSRAKADLSCSR